MLKLTELYTKKGISEHAGKHRRKFVLMITKLSRSGGHMMILEKMGEISLAKEERHFFFRDQKKNIERIICAN